MFYNGDPTGIGFDLAINRFLDARRESRRMRAEGKREMIAQIQINQLTNDYNDLVDRFNRKASVCDKALQRAEALEAQLREKDREIAELRKHLANAERGAEEGLYWQHRFFHADGLLEQLRSQKD